MRCWLLLPILYFVAGIFTFAWIYDGWEVETSLDGGRHGLTSVGGGLFWPLYWSGTGALYVVRRAKTPALKACMDADGNSWAPEDGICRYKRREGAAGPSRLHSYIVCEFNSCGLRWYQE